MRAFWISIVLLFVLLGAIVCNYCFINRVANRLEQALDAMPDIESTDCAEATRAFLADWEESIDLVGLSVSYPIVDRVSEQAITLVACAECGDLYGYRTALALLRDALGDMRRLEKFSLGNLF
jgi:hypothetical protein